MKVTDIVVSVVVLTYGQEQYIRKTLDSILMQQVAFKYEIIVGEDCSPDGTRQILEEYEKQYPDKFVMLYRANNLGMNANLIDAIYRVNGRYIAFCEGDDYWLDKNKLQKQVDFLETNHDYIATAHHCQVVDAQDKNIDDVVYFLCADEEYSYEHCLRNIHPGQTASIVVRNFFSGSVEEQVLLAKADPPDRMLSFLFMAHGKVRVFQEKMSAYRYVASGTANWTAREICKHDFDIRSANQYKLMLMHAQKYFANNVNLIRCMEKRFFVQIVFLLINRKTSVTALQSEMHIIGNKRQAFMFCTLELVRILINRIAARMNVKWRVKRKCIT